MRTLDPAELVWLAEARELLRGPGVDLTDIAWLGGHVDELMAAWHQTMPSLRWDPLPTTTAVGLAVGDAVVARVPGLEWVDELAGRSALPDEPARHSGALRLLTRRR